MSPRGSSRKAGRCRCLSGGSGSPGGDGDGRQAAHGDSSQSRGLGNCRSRGCPLGTRHRDPHLRAPLAAPIVTLLGQ